MNITTLKQITLFSLIINVSTLSLADNNQINKYKTKVTNNTVSLNLSYSAEDLSSQAARAALQSRIKNAALKVCEDAGSLDVLYNVNSCIKEAVEKAEQQIGSKQLLVHK